MFLMLIPIINIDLRQILVLDNQQILSILLIRETPGPHKGQ